MNFFLKISFFILVVVSLLGVILYEGKELDDVSENGPIRQHFLEKTYDTPLFEGVLASGISWDFNKDRFFLSTDQPHSLFGGKASFYVVNNTLDEILYEKHLTTDGDLEGIAYIGRGEVALISELGTLYFLKEEGEAWVLTGSTKIFHDNKKHKIASLAYSQDNQLLYTAEKQGDKIIYQLSRQGDLISSFDLEVSNQEKPLKKYTIAGMVHTGSNLYLFSEAYSTIFEVNIDSKEISNVYGIRDIHESSGITIRKNSFYLVGDYESYLPPPRFYKILFPQ